jgi:hypothetical protein
MPRPSPNTCPCLTRITPVPTIDQAKQLYPKKETMDTNIKKKLLKEASNGEGPKLTLHLRGLLGGEGKRQREQEDRATTLSPPLPPQHNSEEKKRTPERNKAEAEQNKYTNHNIMACCFFAMQLSRCEKEMKRRLEQR